MPYDDICSCFGRIVNSDWPVGLDDPYSFSSLDDEDEEQLHFFVTAACFIILWD